MKYRRYQPGGVIYTPFISTNGAATQTTGSSTSSTKSSTTPEKISGTMTKEIIDILKSNGIPSDVNAFLTTANSFLVKSQSLSNMSLFGGTDDDYDLSDLITIQKMANDVRFNNEQYNKAVANLDKEDAWSDVALDQRGFMWVQDKDGELKTVHATKFNPEEQYALTNEELLSLRERSSEFAMNRTVLNSMTGTVGVKTVQDYLVGLIEKLGTDIQQGYASKKEQDIFTGAQLLMKNGPDGFYKITDKQQARSLTEAVNYLTNQLARNKGMLNVIQATIAANGGDPSKDMASMIAQMVQNHVDIELKADFDSTATKSAGLDAESKTKESTALGEVPYLVRIGRGDGQYELVNISMRTDSVMDSGAMMAWAANMGNVVDKSGNTLGMDSLPNILAKAEALKATRSKDITFGGQLLTDVEKNFIVYDGTSQLTDVWLPYKNVGGKITPDFDSLKAFNEWNDWVSKNKGLSRLEMMNEAVRKGLDPNKLVFKDGSWTFKPQAMKLFLSFSAYADNDNIEFTKLTEDLTEEMPNSFGSKYKEVFNNLFEYGKTHRSKSDKKVGLGYDTVRRWDLRKGNVFIPIDSDFLAMHMSMTEYAPKADMNRFAARSTAAQQIAYAQDNNVASLGQFR